jgi:hypothetical protein
MTLRFIGEGREGQRNVIARIPLHLAAVDVWGRLLLVQFVFLKLFSILIIGLFPRSFSIGKKFRFRIG